MRNTFTVFDITSLQDAFNSSSIKNDRIPKFLKKYTFEDVYKTDDDSIVFCAGGKHNIDIEFFNFDHPLKRSISIMYWENGEPHFINFGRYEA